MKVMDHAERATVFNQDEKRVDWHDETLWFVREKRDIETHTIPEWEALREAGSQIKNHTLSNLHNYLLEFEKNAKANGVVIHWAADAKEHNEIVLGLLQKHHIKEMVKSKSMLTEECHMNVFLSENGIDVIDSDLGERIVQLAGNRRVILYCPASTKRKKKLANYSINT